MIHFYNTTDFFKCLFSDFTLTYIENNIQLQFSLLNEQTHVTHIKSTFETTMCMRDVSTMLTQKNKYIINGSYSLAPNIQVILFLLDYIKTFIVIYKTDKNQHVGLQKIINNDISIDTVIMSDLGDNKTATIYYSWENGITLIKNGLFKNSSYEVSLIS